MPSFVAPELSCTSSIADQIRRAEVVHDLARGEPRQRGGVARIEVLDVEGRDCDLLVTRSRSDLRRRRARIERRRRQGLHPEVREVVVERPHDRRRRARADVHARGLAGRWARDDQVPEDLVVDQDRRSGLKSVGWTGIPPREVSRPKPAPPSGSTQTSPKALFVGPTTSRVVDLDDHPLEALVEVDSVLRRVEGRRAGLDGVPGRVVVDHRRRARTRPAAPSTVGGGSQRPGPSGRRHRRSCRAA